MEIGMAVAAGSKLQSLFGLSRTMAFAALKSQVFPLERISRLAVVKIHGIDQTPALAVVTGIAIHPQLTFVYV
jgi:hypothetical protein